MVISCIQKLFLFSLRFFATLQAEEEANEELALVRNALKTGSPVSALTQHNLVGLDFDFDADDAEDAEEDRAASAADTQTRSRSNSRSRSRSDSRRSRLLSGSAVIFASPGRRFSTGTSYIGDSGSSDEGDNSDSQDDV